MIGDCTWRPLKEFFARVKSAPPWTKLVARTLAPMPMPTPALTGSVRSSNLLCTFVATLPEISLTVEQPLTQTLPANAINKPSVLRLKIIMYRLLGVLVLQYPGALLKDR